jgi:hypothetical protein
MSLSKIALGDIHFGKSVLVACSTNRCYMQPQATILVCFACMPMARTCNIMTFAKATRLPRVLTRPSHLPQSNPFRTRRTTVRQRRWPSYHPECRWIAPRSATTRFDGSSGRPAHPRAPREHLCQSSQLTWHLFLFPLIEVAVEQQRVYCQHGHVYPRAVFQEWLGQANPRWHAYLAELELTGAQPKTNPDGDVRWHRHRFSDVNPCLNIHILCLGRPR